jgi:hypothetical protein
LRKPGVKADKSAPKSPLTTSLSSSPIDGRGFKLVG